MKFMLNYYPLLIPLAPFLAAVYSALPSPRAGDRKYSFGVFALVVALAAALMTLAQAAAPGHVATRLLICETPWSFLPTIELSIDRLSAVMMVVISGIGLVLYRYSVRYLQSELGQSRYQALLAFTISTLLVMVSSRDLVLLFLAWQLLSWLLCLLAYNYAHLPTARSSFRTFIMLRLGDIAFLAGIVLAYQLWGTVEFSELFKQAAANPITLRPFGGIELSGATAVTLLIFVGAMSKSAQVPLHMWLPESLFAPTPIHGLLHAGIINAGGFLLTRLAPLYVLSPPTLHVVFVVGLVTAVLGTSMMLVQNDIKKTLGYSTIGQMGYMIMECGVGAFSLAIFHLIAHGLFKGTIFLNCGNVIHETRHEPRWPEKPADGPSLSVANWAVGFITSLALPLLILYGAHELLHVPLRDSQGLMIFLFFSWVTASQAMLTLYRLRGASSIKEQGIMLLVVTVATLFYLFAAEQFTGFLYPTPETVTAYYQAASLPSGLFVGILVVAVALVVIGWAGAYSKRLGRPFNLPQTITDIQTTLYLFFVNRLYLDGVALRLRHAIKTTAVALDRSRLFLPIAALVAIVLAGQAVTSFADVSIGNLAVLLGTALLAPLFPLHDAYVRALTRLPRVWGIVLAALMPIAGVYGMTVLIPTLPSAFLAGLAVLALFGAIYASMKAVVQTDVPHLIAYTGVAFYSILWWHIASVGSVAPAAIVYAGAVMLVIVGMMLAWDRVRVRYGNLDLNRVGGLASPMPKFGLCLALLVMAAVGLPPFGLFFGYVGMLLSSSAMSVGLVIVLLTWFGVSWYLFKLMQRLLFGPHRVDLRYDDLRPAEIAAIAIILLLLVSLSVAPHGWLGAEVMEVARTVGEIK
jgi:NADH-quinone oxidoreductase subunit L